ncbi:ABC transporter ATP-binding protein [Mesorhizobium sp. WSM4976]|uniref:ABC transporter ATP-binding protein n=1 Tax=Mesorhizobium sp. WSM4976 TaxID=3038549 RepID=UPI00241657F2|nr:ABC transporter ATP-binding protein [Mesorhizobium sp. WSM4976]MDG4898397.1 ABC transporter ATP-binding protein [Mesorhizobium sp. WSM4976]
MNPLDGNVEADGKRPILEIDSLSKAYGSKIVADNLSLQIGQGEFFTFLGASGSGKSTTLRIVAGLEKPDQGTVLISGIDVSKVPPWRRNVGMMFQQYAVFPNMNVEKNIGYGLRIRNMPTAETAKRVDELLDLVGLAGMSKKAVATLSGGEQQRVALARALAPRPAILLLDEPLSALDEKIRREMQGELKRIQRSTGTTFLYVTHDQEEALTMSDRIVVLKEGKAAQIGTPEAIYLRPENRFVAKFFRGGNLFMARCSAMQGDRATLTFAGQTFSVARGAYMGTTGPVWIAIRAESIAIGPDAGNCPICVPAQLVTRMFRGANADWHISLEDGETAVITTPRHAKDINEGAVAIGFRPDDVILLNE